MDLNPEILQKIIECFRESKNISFNQKDIYDQLQFIVLNVPDFFRYFIYILMSNLRPEPECIFFSQISLISLRRYFIYIRQDQLGNFFQSIIPVLTNIITNRMTPLISQSMILITLIVNLYGEQLIPNFDELLFSLIQDLNTLTIGLDSMIEISIQNSHFGTFFNRNSSYKIKIPHLEFLLNIFLTMTDSPLTGTYLTIILNLLKSGDSPEYLSFISERVLPFIFDNHSNFHITSLLNSMSIVIFFFEKTGDAKLGDFIVFCIGELGDLCFDGLENFTERIPFHPGLVAALFNLLGESEGETAEEFNDAIEFPTFSESLELFECTNKAQDLLSEIAWEYRMDVVSIVLQLASQCQNLRQVFKALYSIADEIPENCQFFELALNHLDDEFRGDAALLVSALSSPVNGAAVVGKLVPLLLDADPRVRLKAIISIDRLFDSEFVASVDASWIPFFFQAFSNAVNEDNLSHASKLSSLIYEILDKLDSIDAEPFYAFFASVFRLFFNEEKSDMAVPAATLMELLIRKLKIGFSSEIESIVARITEKLRQSENTVLFRDNFFELLLSISEVFPEQSAPLMVQPCMAIVEALAQANSEPFQTFDPFWKLVERIFAISPQLFFQSGLANHCVRVALQNFNQNAPSEFLNLVAPLIQAVLQSFNESLVDNLLNAVLYVIQAKKEELVDLTKLTDLLKAIIEFKDQKNTLKLEDKQMLCSFLENIGAK